jgi:hypothetical protein
MNLPIHIFLLSDKIKLLTLETVYLPPQLLHMISSLDVEISTPYLQLKTITEQMLKYF